MDASSREAKTKWQAQQRFLARAAFPLPDNELQQLFDHVDARLENDPCDHTLSLTTGWLADHGHANSRTVDWLREHGGHCDCEVVANALDHWDQNRGLGVQIPDGWAVTYADPSLAGGDWELKEDLLQLQHVGQNRLADLGWYVDHFRILVFQDSFDGERLADASVQDPKSALSTLRALMLQFSS